MTARFESRENKALIEEVRAMRQRIIDDAEAAVHLASSAVVQAEQRLCRAERTLAAAKEKYGGKE